MEWEKLISTKRLGKKGSFDDRDHRSAFESDVDRIIFSNSFKRLSRKTQVHPFSTNDHVHNRLTHSLEVSSVGRSLGKKLGERINGELPENISSVDLGNIVQAACLAHDIGNPPFGHAGESAISQWFDSDGGSFIEDLSGPIRRDINFFEGNAQGFRVLTNIENHLWNGGLQLTYTTLAAFLKYPIISRELSDKEKFGVFISEEDIFKKIVDELGLKKLSENRWSRHPLAFLTEAADDICYATIDLEDAVEMGIIKYKKVKDLLMESLEEDQKKALENQLEDADSFRVNFARIRGPVFENLINSAIDSFMANYPKIMAGTFQMDLFEALGKENKSRIVIEKAKEEAKENIYTESFKANVELGCFETLSSLLEAYCKAAVEQINHLESPEDEVKVSWRSKLILRQLGNHKPEIDNAPNEEGWSKHLCLRRVLDYVAGMTDNHANEIGKSLRGIVD